MQFSTNSSSPKTRRQRFLQLLWGSFSGRDDRQPDPSRSRLQLEPLEKRQLLAGDMELLFTEPGAGLDLSSDTSQLSDTQLSDTQLSDTSYTSGTGLQAVGMGEGEAADDLVERERFAACGLVFFFGRPQLPLSAHRLAVQCVHAHHSAVRRRCATHQAPKQALTAHNFWRYVQS